MVKKTVKFNKSGIDKLPNDKPVVYEIMTESGKTIYTGVAKRGRVRDRIEEHLRRGKDRIPGNAVKIEQLTSISEARGMQSLIIKKTKPKYMVKKTVKFNKSGIDKLPNDKPVVYEIMTESGKTIYTGVAKRGRVRGRLEEHLRRGKDRIPGTAIKIEQLTSISKARGKQSLIIKKTKPKYNAQRAVISFFEPDSFSGPKGRNAVKKRTVKK